MTPYPQLVRLFTSDDILLFIRLRHFFQDLPDLSDPFRGSDEIPRVSCHTVCRALAVHFPVTVVDGHVLGPWEHSWLMVRTQSFKAEQVKITVIIDAYPIMATGPFMVCSSWQTPWGNYYEAGSPNALTTTPPDILAASVKFLADAMHPFV